MPYFLAFGVFAGVAAIVPFFGVLLSTVVPALFALGAFGVTKALLVAALGVVVHIIEANFVAPVVMERQVNLPPVVTIAGVLLIGKLFGLGLDHRRADPGPGDDPGPPHPDRRPVRRPDQCNPAQRHPPGGRAAHDPTLALPSR